MNVIKLDDADTVALLMILGYRSGEARSRGDMDMFRMAIRLTNTIGSQLPNYTSYEVEPEDPTDRPEERI